MPPFRSTTHTRFGFVRKREADARPATGSGKPCALISFQVVPPSAGPVRPRARPALSMLHASRRACQAPRQQNIGIVGSNVMSIAPVWHPYIGLSPSCRRRCEETPRSHCRRRDVPSGNEGDIRILRIHDFKGDGHGYRKTQWISRSYRVDGLYPPFRRRCGRDASLSGYRLDHVGVGSDGREPTKAMRLLFVKERLPIRARPSVVFQNPRQPRQKLRLSWPITPGNGENASQRTDRCDYS